MNNEAMISDSKTVLDLHPRLVTKRRKHVSSSENPREELRKLVQQHRALTKTSVAIMNMASDRKNHKTGEMIKCRLPEDVQAAFKELSKNVAKKKAKTLESAMLSELKKIPVYKLFLSKVYGLGPVVSAYLISEIDIHRAVKPSALRRFCGLAVINGRLERRTKGTKSAYSSEMRVRLYQAFGSMWKNAAKLKKTTKYLDIWINAKHRKMQLAVDGKINNGVREVSAKGYAHSYGWHKAADILIEDLYTVWRAIEGLEVWPSYYAAKLGYEHGGKICVNAPKMLTVDDALALVGDVGGRVSAVEMDPGEASDEDSEDEEIADSV